MRIALLGSGGREHALAWQLAQSTACEALYILPGNGGTAQVGENVPIAVDEFDKICAFCREKHIECVLVGPEVPLVQGITNYMAQDKTLAHVLVIGPTAEAAQLEGSKAFAKAYKFYL